MAYAIDDDFDNEENGSLSYESYAMRRAQIPHGGKNMTQQMTTKIAPSYDGRTGFFAYEDAIDD